MKLDVQEISAQSFRRQTSGRDNITFMMQKILDLDTQVFEKAPAFDPFGVCRLRFEGAEEFKVNEIIEHAPKAIEFLYLSLSNCKDLVDCCNSVKGIEMQWTLICLFVLAH